MSKGQDYKILAMRLRQAVQNYEFKEPENFKADSLQFPAYPTVEVHDDEIIIVGEDGDKEIWDVEEDQLKAYVIAEELELELKAILYVKYHLANYISKLANDLVQLNIQKGHINDIVYEGYKSLSKWFIELDDLS